MTRRGYDRKTIFHLLALAGVLVFSTTTYAQDATEADDDEDAAQLQKVAVTGSRIKRTELEGPAPVYIIDQEQMAQRGYVTVYEALEDLTINNGFKFEGPEAALFTPDVQTINLRSFGIGNTLVLINGRRLTNYPAAYQSNATVFNFGAIPTAAVERIEILATGASAIYGSDAVAGVVNIILRQDIDENVVNLLWGTPTETKSFSDGAEYRIQFLTGQTFDRGNYTLTLEYTDREPILGRDFDQFDDQELDYPYGTGVANRTILDLDWFKNAFGFRPYYEDPGVGTCENIGTNRSFRAPNIGYFCNDPQDGVQTINFRNGKEAYSIYFNGNLEVGDNGLELFTDLLYYHGESESFNTGPFVFDDILDLNTPDSVGFGFFDWYLAQRIFTDTQTGLQSQETFDDDAYTIAVGARGVWADTHDWEFSINYSDYQYDATRPWVKYQAAIDTFLGTYLGVGFFGDPWWSGGTLGEGLAFGFGDPDNLFGALNQAAIDTIGIQRYGNETSDTFLSYTQSGDLLEFDTGPLSYAFVLEYEDQDFSFVPDDLIQQAPPTRDSEGNPITGLQGSGWYKLTGYNGDGDRQRWAVGGEIRIPLHETFLLNLAGRYDDYDSGSTSFGSDFTPSASFEWRPVTDLLVRGGYTESFRAPDLAQVFVNTGFFTTDFDFISCYQTYLFQNNLSPDDLDPITFENTVGLASCDAVSTFARRTGAQNLGPDEEPLDAETGSNWWIGFSWEVLDNLTLTVDYTHLELEDRVLQEDTQDLLDDEWECFKGTITGDECNAVDNRIDRRTDPTTGISFINEFNVTPINQFFEEVDSIDATLRYTLNTDVGLFNFTGDYSHILEHNQKLTADSEEVNLRDDPIQGGWDFRGSFVGSVSYSRGDFSTTATFIRRGGTTPWRCTSQTTGENVCDGRRVPSYITWNWTGQYNWTDDFSTRLRIVNVFDEDPPTDDSFLFFDDPWYNYFVYPGAGIGRQVAVEAELTF